MLHGISHVDLFTCFDLDYTDVFLYATDIKGLTRIVKVSDCPKSIHKNPRYVIKYEAKETRI